MTVAGVCGTAVAGAVATAIITPDFVRDLLGTSTGQTVDYHRVEDGSGALAFEVPTSWSALNSTLDGVDGAPLGPGLTAGPDPSLPANTSRPRAFLGAHRVVPDDQGSEVPARDDLEADLVQQLRSRDWGLEQCVFDREEELQRDDGVDVVYRVWTDCGQGGQTVYDGFATPPQATYVAFVQVQLSEGVEDEVAAHVLETFRVLPERLDAPG
ncbi:hypothetical protein [Blastococcus sp. SYSU DS0533]